jgi:hypothetical protein
MMSGMCGMGGAGGGNGGTAVSFQSAAAFQTRAAQSFQAGAMAQRMRVMQQRRQIQMVNLRNQQIHAMRMAVKTRNEGGFESPQPAGERSSAQTSFASIASVPVTRSEILTARRTAYENEMQRRRGE